MPNLKKTSSLNQFISIFVSCSLIFSQSLAYAQKISVPSETSSIDISLSKELGKVEESFQGSSDKTIIYIQDAHDSLEAQENIAKTISYLVEQRRIKTVYEEGYEGPVPTDEYFGFMKDPIIKEKVSYFLMDKLRIGGAEYAHINRKNDFKLIGADNIKLHLENIKQYRETAELSQDTKQDLQAAQSEISRLANQRFSKELKEWMKLKERLTTNQLDLLSYLKRIKDLFMQHTSKEEFQTRYSNIDLILSVETANKKESAEKAKAIDSKVLFQEIEQLENDYANTQLKNEQDKKTFQYYKGLQLLSRLDEIKLTSTEFDAVKESFQKLKTDDLAKFVAKSTNKPVVLFKRWEQNIQNAIRFYELAGARDQSLGKNFDEFLKNKNEKVALLVFGGFHKDEIKQILQAKNLSYSILMPTIGSVDQRHQDYYKQLMSMGSYSFEVPMNLAKAARAITTFLRARIIDPQLVRAELRALSLIVARNKNLDRPLLSRSIEEQLSAVNLRSEVRLNIEELTKDKLPAEYHNILEIDNLPFEVHLESVKHPQYGRRHGSHLQEMLDVLVSAASHSEIPQEYVELLQGNPEFFQLFILIHDLGKLEVPPVEVTEGAYQLKVYKGYEAKSVEMMDRDARLATGLKDRNILRETVRLHGALYFAPGLPEGVPTTEQFQKFLTDQDVDLALVDVIIPYLIAADYLDTLGTLRPATFGEPWQNRVSRFDQAYKNWKAERIQKSLTENAAILNLDVPKVTELTEKNAKVNYGATFVAGHPITGTAGEILQRWRQELLTATNGKFKINADFSHATIGALARSQDQPIQAEDLAKADFNKVIAAIEAASGYKIHFKEIRLSDGKEGNLVLIGEVEGDGLNLLQKAFSEAGLPLKWKAQESGKAAKVFVTLGHINIPVLESLTAEETQALKAWIQAHSKIEEAMTLEVQEIRLAIYKQRMLEGMITPDVTFKLGVKSQFENGEALKSQVINGFEHHTRFEKLKAQEWYGILTDVDYSLTDENRIVPSENIREVVAKLRRGVRVGLVSSRAYEIDPRFRKFDGAGQQIGGARDIKEVVDQIRLELGADQSPLNYLDVFPEDSAYGFNVGNPEIVYDFGVKPPLESLEDREAFERAMLDLLRPYAQEKFGIEYKDEASIIFKSRVITLQLPRPKEIEQDQTFLRTLEERIGSFFAERKIKIDLKWSGDSFEIKPKNVDKALSVLKFSELLESKPFISTDDQGQPGGNGAPLVNRVGGISLNRFNPDNPDVTAVSLLSGRKGASAWLLAIHQLNFKPSRSELRAKEQNAAILGFELPKVEDLTDKNARVNYGATFVAGHPLSGVVGENLQRWQQELLAGTSGKFKINSDFSHATVGALVRSQDQPIREENLAQVDFDKVLQAIQTGSGYKIHFKEVKFSDGKEGNLVLIGEVEGDGLSLLQKTFSESGLPLKWKAQEPGKPAKVFVTLGHVNANILGSLTQEEAQGLKQWVEAHAVIQEPMTLEVNEIRLALYKQRMLEGMVGPDIVFHLGNPSEFENGSVLKAKIVDAFANPRSELRLINNVNVASVLQGIENKRILIDFNDLARNFSDEQIKEVVFIAGNKNKNVQILLYNVDVSHPLGQFFRGLKLPDLKIESDLGGTTTNKALANFNGEVVNLSSASYHIQMAALRRVLGKLGISRDRQYLLAYRDQKSGTLGIGLRDIQRGDLKQVVDAGKLKQQLPDYMDSVQSQIFVANPALAGMASWQTLYNSSVAFARAA